MSDQQAPQDVGNKMGKWMIATAWILGLGLLVLFFDDQLSRQYNPNPSPASQSVQGGIEVRLKRNRHGHYVSGGFINDQEVIFLLDTGATNVSIPAHLATRLGLTPGYRYPVRTANGTIQVAQTQVDSLTLGDIRLQNVEAHLNPGMQSEEILLGMSALKQLEFSQRGEWLILRSL